MKCTDLEYFNDVVHLRYFNWMYGIKFIRETEGKDLISYFEVDWIIFFLQKDFISS